MNSPAGIEGYCRELEALRLPIFRTRKGAGPQVVAIEGPNGAGKSTLCASLAAELGGLSCLGTDEAWFSEQFKTRMIRDAEWHASALFFLSGCFEQMRLLRSRPERLAVMDRSLWSTLAVHAAESASRLGALLSILKPIAAEVRIPDLTLVLDASFEVCQSRIAHKTGAARALDELTATQTFHAREHAFYRWLAGQTPDVTFLDVTSISPDETVEQAQSLVKQRLKC